MIINDLKERLLKYDLVIQNEYLNKYCELIINNINNKKEKFKTQKHHFIPVSYYKEKYNFKHRKQAEEYANNDSNNLLVELKYTDHVLSHCYLCLCAKSKVLQHNMMISVYKLKGSYNMCITDIEKEFIQNSEVYQKAYEKDQENNWIFNPMFNKEIREKHDMKMSQPEIKEKLSKSMKKSRKDSNKTKHIHLGRKQIRIDLKDLQHYLNLGWEEGNPKGMIYIHKDKKDKKIWPEELDDYIKQGWKKGRYCLSIIADENEREEFKTTNSQYKNKRQKPEGFNKSSDFRKAQSIRLNNYYNNNPNFKTKSKKPIRIFKENNEFIFESVKHAEKFIGIAEKWIGKGILSKSLKLGYINIKNCIYYRWNIEYYKGEVI